MGTPDAGQNIITRGLPKTGQITQYQAGDDGQYEAGWWKSRLNANNRERWIAKTIGGDDIVLDRATGLMWAADGNAAGCGDGLTNDWQWAILVAEGLIFAGFDDWRLPNMFELASILRLEGAAPLIEQPPFSNTFSGFYWNSTTDPADPTKAFSASFNTAWIVSSLKTVESYMRAVRGGL